MRLQEAAKRTGISPSTAKHAIKRGAIPASKKVVPCVTGRKPIDPGQTAASLAQERGIKLHSARRALLRAKGKGGR